MRKRGVLVISHGSRSPKWIELIDEAVARIRRPQAPQVFSAFLELVEGRLIQDGIDALEAQGVEEMLVLPLFVSSGSTHVEEIRQAFGLAPHFRLEHALSPFRVRAQVQMGVPIDDDPLIAEVLLDKIKPISQQPEHEILLLVGHGSGQPGFCQRWQKGLHLLAQRVGRLGGFAQADAATLLPDQLDQKLVFWRESRPDCRAVVFPLFLSEGYFTNEVIPRRLAGFDCIYEGQALLPHPLLSEWMARQVRNWIKSNSE